MSALLLVLCLAACDVTTAAVSPTAPPTTTIAPGVPVTAATLGGPLDAFSAKYGMSGLHYTVNGVSLTLNDARGTDGKPRVFEMLVAASDAHVWTMDEAKPICTAFLPPDATVARSITSSDGSPEDLYTSPDVSASFTPSAPGYAADGRVSSTYERPSTGAGGVSECDLKLGT
jgi:hypothetical protein